MRSNADGELVFVEKIDEDHAKQSGGFMTSKFLFAFAASLLISACGGSPEREDRIEAGEDTMQDLQDTTTRLTEWIVACQQNDGEACMELAEYYQARAESGELTEAERSSATRRVQSFYVAACEAGVEAGCRASAD
tara:strand:- start:58831 stop:59238 length:408 start_codon:yes stop_codon:yes gene_type:complete